ncbi:acetate--CoA ligase [bacterium]|nr:MAG: acetate--CoA ligase [bacterium]
MAQELNMAELQQDATSGELFLPTEHVLDKAIVTDFDALRERANNNPDAFWEEQARELEWFSSWHTVKTWQPEIPKVEWFVGATCNITVNALDRHVKAGKGNKTAYRYVPEEGTEQAYTVSYQELLERVNRIANGLKSLGVTEGDRVTIYMALTPDLPAAMLACARLGAIHCVVYAGFSAPALRQRIEDSGSKIVISSDYGWRRGKKVDLAAIVKDATEGVACIEKQIIQQRGEAPLPNGAVSLNELWAAQSGECEPAVLSSEAPLFYLYTSGTTGKPKGICHVHGGYGVGTSYTHRIAFDVHDDDVYFCSADPGWITGHSYVVYGPLINGATVVLGEGALDFPDAGRWWKMVEEQKITIFYSTPTAIRALMRFGDEFPAKYDLSSLRVLGSVGEPINPEAWLWFYKNIGHENCALVDTWWQTETGQFLISTVPSYPTKPGSPGKPYPGINAKVVNSEGEEVPRNEQGFLVIDSQWPAMMRTIFGDHERYAGYWQQIPGYYSVGDAAKMDEDGYIRVIGRTDDVLNVSGYRIGTAEVESALVSHPAVAESAVIGKPDPLKGESIKAFVILRVGFEASDDLAAQLKKHVRVELSPIAMPGEIEFVPSLPKTRSGKIMRRVLKAKELGTATGDISTLED